MIRQIPVTLPWSFENALGYFRSFRWVAFYWEPCGDEAIYDDGYCSTDCNWGGFLAFTKHPKLSYWLSGYDLGSSDGEAKHWLLCDLESRDIFVGERSEVHEYLMKEVQKYLPASPEDGLKAELTPEDMTEVLAKIRDEMQQIPAPSIAEITERMRRDQEAVKKMVKELGE
jgi:hypothetical protein